MNRPIYENDKTLAAEDEFRIDLCSAWGLALVKNPRSFGVDWSVCDGNRIIGLVEAKCRRYNVDSFSDYLISADKLMRAVERSEFYKVPFVLVVRWQGTADNPKPGDRMVTLRWTDIGDLNLEMGGRVDRNDPADQEPCAMIPSKMFTEISEDFPEMWERR